MTMGVIVGNRGFFPDHLAKEGRDEIIKALTNAGIEPVVLSPEESKYGAVETRVESRKCADLFRAHRDRIDGVIVTLPNFGEERAIADTLRLADLNVPVLVQATPDSSSKMTIKFRRDSFCGKMSACNNLSQYGIPYSITTQHTEAPDSDLFRRDLEWFAGVCRVVKGLRRVRIGAIGAQAGGVQYGALQREDPGTARHLDRDRGPDGDSGPHPQDERLRRRRAKKARRD